MSKKVKVDGKVFIVPDDATPDEIDQIATGKVGGSSLTMPQMIAKGQNYEHQSSPARAALKELTPDMKTVTDFGSDLAGAVKGVGHMLFDPAKSITDIPVTRAVKGYYNSVGEANDAARAAADRGDTTESMIESAAAGLPLVGPLIHGVYGKSAGVGASRIGQAMTMAPEGSAIPNPVLKVGGKVARVAQAEGDPGKVYNRYLDARAGTPAKVPATTPRIDSALMRKVEINYPEVAERMQQGTTTLKDLDVVRQVANDASSAAFTARGIPTQVSKGFKGAADKARSALYPQIDTLNDLPAGTAGKLKRIQGESVEMGKPPKWGHFPARWPTVAVSRLGVRPALAAVRNIRTRLIDSELPEPMQTPAPPPRPAPKGLLNAGPIEMGPGPDTSGTVRVAAPPVEGTTRAVRKGLLLEEPAIPQNSETSVPGRPAINIAPDTRAVRKGLLLPEKAGGKIELKSGDPMAGRELTPEELLKLMYAN